MNIKPYGKNAKKHPEKQLEKIKESILAFGFKQPIVVDKSGVIIAGHGRYLAATRLLGWKEYKLAPQAPKGEAFIPYLVAEDLDEDEIKAYRLADNKLNESEWDMELVIPELKALPEDLLEATGFSQDDIASAEWNEVEKQSLRDDFIIPPFSVWDTKQTYWRARRDAWRGIFGDSRDGRDEDLLGEGLNTLAALKGSNTLTGTSEFDPVIAEISYKWFCPQKGSILDPFAGGVVRGAVASVLGYNYTGIDLSNRQIEANKKAFKEMMNTKEAETEKEETISDPKALTPIHKKGGIYFKREDLFEYNGARGAKVRGCLHVIENTKATELTTAGSRKSPQVEIVACVAQKKGLKCTVHTPEGEDTSVLKNAAAYGATIIKHKAGYNTVIVARAREYAEKTGAFEVPFGMVTIKTIEANKFQVQNIPKEAKRLVIPVGSGMTLATVLTGLKEYGISIPVLGIWVGKNPEELLEKYAPKGWRENVELIQSEEEYSKEVYNKINGITVDPIYEAKCIKYLKKDDLLWIVGRRLGLEEEQELIPLDRTSAPVKWIQGNSAELEKLVPEKEEYDMIFSCPPYYDLEQYSDDPKDLSNKASYAKFLEEYKQAIRKSVDKLKKNRFAVFVVGDIRDKSGFYQGFVHDTVRAFEEAGARFYNDIVLLNALATAPVRSRRPFSENRKVTKVHQNILAFYKGDPEEIKNAYINLPKVETMHQSVVVFYKGDIAEIKANYKIVPTEGINT